MGIQRTATKTTTNAWKRTEAKEIIQNKKREERKKHWKLATWNVRGINGKEIELSNECNKYGLDIVGVTETKKKGSGEEEMEKGQLFVYSGVEMVNRAKAGVGCIIAGNRINQLQNWEGHSDRIITVELKTSEKNTETFVVVYGPNEDEKVEVKNTFWEELTQIIEKCLGTVFIIGDFNSRVGNKNEGYERTLGKHGEKVKNNNGQRLIDFCQLNNFIVANTFYQHKNIHKITRAVPNRGEESIIDYILVQEGIRSAVIDVKVRRGAEIGSDHHLLVANIQNEDNYSNQREKKGLRIEFELIKSFKLRDSETAEKYSEYVKTEAEKIMKVNSECLEELWESFSNILLNAARKACGVGRVTNRKRQTAWWSEDVKEQVKRKKQAWQKYLNNKTNENHEKYKQQRRNVKEIIREAKQVTWRQFGEKIETDSKSNQKLFYKTIKSLRKGRTKKIDTIRNKDGLILTEGQQIMSRWKEYFEELLNRGAAAEIEQDGKSQTAIGHNNKITIAELTESIKRLKTGKAPGHDKITAEMVKAMGEEGGRLLLKIFNKAWNEDRIPRDWEKGVIVPIYKKGDTKECKNYRGITLLSVILKLYESILEKRLRAQVEDTLEQSQSGFRKGRGTRDHTFTIQEIINKSLLKEKNAYFAFIDLEKAFDTTPRHKIWESLQNRKVDTKLITVIQSLYKYNSNYIVSQGRISEEFTTGQGLRQGGVMSPILFTVFMDDVIKRCNRRTRRMYIGYRYLQRIEISECAFADDIAIISGSKQDLQNSLTIWSEELELVGMKINNTKTKVMVANGENRYEELHVRIGQDNIEQVQNFQYLGIIIEERGDQEREINKRIENTLKIFHAINSTFFNRREIAVETKIKVYKTICRPILTYGSETWITTSRQKSKIQATEMIILRRIMGITRLHRIRNETIQKALEVQPVLKFIEQRQLSWWGHLQRLGEEVPVRRVWETRGQKKKKRGRPRQTWNEVVTKILHERGVTWEEGKTLARNKKEWSKFVYAYEH